MLGQFWLEPELELDPLDPELELEPELVLPDPEVPELEPDDGVVVEEPDVEELLVELEPVPVLPVPDVVAALATSAPPATRPEVSAPTAKTLRRRICMSCCPFRSCDAPAPPGRYRTRCARHLWRPAELPQCGGGVVRRLHDDSQEPSQPAHSGIGDDAQRGQRRHTAGRRAVR
jgi:hypothetical protein